MLKKFRYLICSPSLFLRKRTSLKKYITLNIIVDKYKERLYLENLSIHDGFFEGYKKRRELKEEVENGIYMLFSKKLEGIQKWSGGDVEIINNNGFSEIIIKAGRSYEAKPKLEEVLDEIKKCINGLGESEKIYCSKINYHDVSNNEFGKH